MLDSFETLSDEAVLQNANTIAQYWEQEFPPHHRLAVNPEGLIEVIPCFNNSAETSTEMLKMFAEEKYILLWHWENLKPLIKKRATAVSSFSTSDLHTYYQAGIVMQGLIQLCASMHQQFALFAAKLEHFENFTSEKQSEQKNDALKSIVKEMEVLLQTLRADQKLGLLSMSSREIRINSTSYHKKMFAPRSFAISDEINAHFSMMAKHWEDPSKMPFKGSLQFYVNPLPIVVLGYPSFSPDSTPIEIPDPKQRSYSNTTLSAIRNGIYGTTPYVQSFMNQHLNGVIPYQKVNLLVTLMGPFQLYTIETLIIYFQFMVELAALERYSQIVLYAPYDISAIAYSMGFFSNDEEQPTLTQQKELVFHQLKNKEAVPILERFHYLTNDVNQEEILRPFYFNMEEMGSRPLYFTGTGTQKTYAALIKEKRQLDNKKFAQGIFPSFHQLPFTPYHTTYAARKKLEISGKPKTTGMAYEREKIDYRWLNDNQALQSIGATAGISETIAPAYNKILRFKAI